MNMNVLELDFVKIVEKNVDLLEIPPDSGGYIFLDYDAETLRLRYLVTESAQPGV